MGFAFDPPDPAGVRDTVDLLKTALDRAGDHAGLPLVDEILAREAAARSGPLLQKNTPEEQTGSQVARAREAAHERRDLNAFARLFSPAEASRMAGGASGDAGPLAGLPFAFKDVFFAHGHRPHAGTPYRFHARETAQAGLVSRLLAAGGVPVGATNLDPLSYSTTGENPFHGAPVNPRDAALLAGGSSSGSSVAVAAGIVPFAIGTDTGGSIRIPAALCGVWGWKPTNGLLDISGIVPLSPSHDCPAVAAAGAAMLHRVADAVIDRESPARRGDAGPLRIGVLESLFAASDADTGEALARFLAVARADRPVAISAPDLALCNSIATIITGYEAARLLKPVFDEMPAAFTANVRQRLATGASIDRRDYDAARRLRSRLLLDHLAGPLSKCDVIVSPVTPRAAYRREELNGPAAGVRKLTLELLEFNRWVNSLGLPAVAIPVKVGDSGKMAAIQIIGRPCGDLDLLRFVRTLPL